MTELGIAHRIRWRATSKGYYIDGKLYKWGDPLALLSFPLLGPIDRFRYARHVFMASNRRDWSELENSSARDWIVSQAGEKIWNLLWKRSFDLKFYELADSVSAPWLGVRIKRLAVSRRSIFQEELGYIDGGTEVLVGALVKGIEANGGKVLCREPVQRVEIRDGNVVGARTPNGWYDASRDLDHGNPIRDQAHSRPARRAPCQARCDPQYWRRLRCPQAQEVGHPSFLGEHQRHACRGAGHCRVLEPQADA